MKKRIVILASEHCMYSGVASPMDMFIQAGVTWNGFLGLEPSPFFEVHIVTADGKAVQTYNDMTIQPHASIDQVDLPDLIFIPSHGFHFAAEDPQLAAKLDWLRDCHRRGSRLASACTGAFLLARTGLLDGRMATTHWGAARAFRETFPKVKLRTDLLVTDDHKLYCGGGVTADLNLSLYLIQQFCGREVAIQCSKCTLVDIDRLSQAPFTTFIPEKDHNDALILQLQHWIDRHQAEEITIETLARQASLSPRQLNRRFKQATGESILTYLQKTKIEIVKTLLEQTNRKFADITQAVGYHNESHLRRLFKRQTGLSPKAYRQKFSSSI
ncbi:MAG: GlxA family transcriptional regulator [Wenzhouxiangellaceae bacterium]